MTTILRTNCDVLEVRGGSAGVAAAIIAGRTGADLVLIEQHGCPGGKATAANAGTICGLYYIGHKPNSRYVSDEFPKEFAERIIARSGKGPDCNCHGLHYLPHRPFDFRRVCDRVLSEAGVRLYLHINLAAISGDRAIREVNVISLDQPF